MTLPLVSCIMPTYGRPDYVAESIAMFLDQDYEAKELIILNDCPGQVLRGDFPGVRIVNSCPFGGGQVGCFEELPVRAIFRGMAGAWRVGLRG